MKTIYKYPLAISAELSIAMPTGAIPLYVSAQGDTLMLWALVDTDQPHQVRHFHVYGTGHPIDEKSYDGPLDIVASYIGTAFMYDGTLVWHVFEAPNAR